MNQSLKRQKILGIFANGDLLTANEVCKKVPGVDRATVYRNLKKLAEEGILREVNIRHGIASYEISKRNDYHQHFICTNCDKVEAVDVSPEKIKEIMPAGVSFEDFELNLKGRCGECENG